KLSLDFKASSLLHKPMGEKKLAKLKEQVGFRLEVLLIGSKAAVASPVYTSLERGQHEPHIVGMAPSFRVCQW
ncbi:hypothetical protein JOQ06_012028, partial [Pogonophryne albipinna]